MIKSIIIVNRLYQTTNKYDIVIIKSLTKNERKLLKVSSLALHMTNLHTVFKTTKKKKIGKNALKVFSGFFHKYSDVYRYKAPRHL